MAALPEGLLDSVRNYLDITWNDADTDKKLTGIIERGIKYINRVSGTENDYTVEDKPKELLLDYCLYVRSNALSVFQKNYEPELLSLQIAQGVKNYEAENPITSSIV
jgi:hypothetical protein